MGWSHRWVYLDAGVFQSKCTAWCTHGAPQGAPTKDGAHACAAVRHLSAVCPNLMSVFHLQKCILTHVARCIVSKWCTHSSGTLPENGAPSSASLSCRQCTLPQHCANHAALPMRDARRMIHHIQAHPCTRGPSIRTRISRPVLTSLRPEDEWPYKDTRYT